MGNKVVKFTVGCKAIYHSSLELPDCIEEDEVLNYIRDHLPECSVNDLTWIDDDEPISAVTEDDIKYIF